MGDQLGLKSLVVSVYLWTGIPTVNISYSALHTILHTHTITIFLSTHVFFLLEL